MFCICLVGYNRDSIDVKSIVKVLDGECGLTAA